MLPPALRMFAAACAVLLIAGSVHAAVYVNRDYYWDGYNQEWRYNIVDRHYNDGQTVTWNADSDFGRQGSGPEYIVEAQVFVNEGARLNIGQGVTVKFSEGTGMYVRGILDAQGSQTGRIVITSASSGPLPGSWREILFQGAGANGSRMSYCDVSYGGDGAYIAPGGIWHHALGNIAVLGCSPQFENCTFSQSGNSAFFGLDGCQASINQCQFTNSPVGIRLAGSAFHQHMATPLPIRSSVVTNNGLAASCSAEAAGAFASNNTVTGNTRNACEIYGGHFQTGVTWRTMNGSPVWYLTGDVYCDEGGALNIEAGGCVKLQGCSLYSRGIVTAAGTQANPITITSYRDDSVGGDSNGDGLSLPAPSDWGTILLAGSGSSNSSFNYCRIRYGGNGRFTANLGFWQYERGLIGLHGSNASVANSLLSDSGNHGLFLMNGSRPQISTTTINGCASYAICCDDINSNPSLTSCSAAGNGRNGIRIPWGTLTGTRTWYKSIPYVLEDHVWLDADAALTVQPGTAVKFAGGWGLYVKGNLQAVGTSAEPIYFTHLNDDVYGDTNNDGASTVPEPGTWSDIALVGPGASASRMEWCVVRYGGNGAYTAHTGTWYNHRGNVFTHDCAPVLKSCIFEHSGNHGLYSRWASNPVIENCTFRNNPWGIVVEDDAFQSTAGTPRVRNCIITQNTRAGWIHAEALSQFDANNIVSGNVSNGLRVYGSEIVNESATWRRMMGTPTIVIEGTVRVPAGKTLTITQNNVIKFTPGSRLYSFGTLLAMGSDGNRIYFTSEKDDSVDGDTNADGSGSAPSPGDWNSILFSGAESSGSLLRNCTVRYGAAGSYDAQPGYWLTHNGAVIIRQSDAALQQVQIASAATYGIVVLDGSHPAFTSTAITGCGSYAIWQHITSNASLALCSATGNAWNGIYQQGGAIDDARTWYRSIPYVLAETLSVTQAGQLTLQPGAVVKSHPGIGIYCLGNLQAVSEDPATPIVFTSVRDDSAGGDTNNDGSATSPAPAGWRELLIHGPASSASRLKNCAVRYAGDNGYTSNGGFWHYAYGNLLLSSTSASVEQCVLSNSGNVGIYCRADCLADIAGCRVRENTSHAIYAEDSYNTLKNPLPIRGNLITGNLANAAMSVNANASLSIAGDNTVQENAQNGIDVRSGAITFSGVWHRVSAGNCPFIITGDVSFASPTVLTVEPGVTVKFRPNGWLGVGGQMVAEGTNEDRIAFTSFKDDTLGGDTNGDGSASAPAGGDYAEVAVYGGGAASVFRNCIFRYGANVSYHSRGGFWHYSEGNVFLNGVAPVFDHCEFSFSGRDGVASGDADVHYQSCTFASNTRMGLYTWGDSDVTLNSCIFSGNPYAATQVNGEQGGSITASYCDIIGVNYLRKLQKDQYGYWVWVWTDTFPAGPGNFSADPAFVNAPVGDFTLRPVSPCINTGDPSKTDPDGSRLDVGAYPSEGIWNPMTTGSAKLSTDGTELLLIGKVVTAGTDVLAGRFYIEEMDRSGGLKIVSSEACQEGSLVNVFGRLAVVDGERALTDTQVYVFPAGAAVPAPLHIVGKAVGGRSLNQFTPGVAGSSGTYNLGLLISVSGRVTATGTGCFWLDDGSGREAEGGRTGLKVESAVPVSVGQMLKVTGISAAYVDGSTVRSVVLTRKAQDVAVLD
jgi:hypothetical protein